MAEQDLDRNEQATPFKLSKAREKGQVAKSADVVSCVVFAVAVLYLSWQGWTLVQAFAQFALALASHAGKMEPGGESIWPLLHRTLVGTMELLLPFCLMLMGAGIVANVAQTGPVLSGAPVQIDFQRINPLTGLNKLFSLRTLFDAARACAKLILLSAVAWWALRALAPQLPALAWHSAQGFVRVLLQDLASFGWKMVGVLLLIALVDLIYTRREFAGKMRMSRREIKDETKNREGDPRIRARLRQLRIELFKRSQGLRRTREADVLITNPRQIAVALRYEHGQMQAPRVLAKGAGHMAGAMRALAAKHRVPTVRQPALARELYRRLDADQAVPPELYAPVAKVIVWVFAMRQRQSQRQGALA